jgi:hypothetical protein
MMHPSPMEIFGYVVTLVTLLLANWWVSELRPDGRARAQLSLQTSSAAPFGIKNESRSRRLRRWQISSKDEGGKELATPEVQCSALTCNDPVSFIIQEGYAENTELSETEVYGLCNEHAREALASFAQNYL